MIPIDSPLLALAGVGLAGAPVLPRRGWDEQLDAVFHHGLAGFLAVSAAAGSIDISGPLADRLRLRLREEATQAVWLEGELMRLAPLLDGFPVVVLKGPVLAHAAYPDPLLRPFTDLDLLIPGPRLEEFVVALATFGYRRARPEPAPGFDARVGKAITLTHPGGVVIDLHRNLVSGAKAASIEVDEIVADRVTVAVGSMAVPAPSWEAHLIECALHAVIGDGLARALSLRDVAQVALDPRLDVDAAIALAARWQVSDALADGLRAATDGLGLAPPDALAAMAGEPIDPDASLPAAVRSARSRLEDLRRGDLRHRATLTRAMVAPSPAFLRWRYGDLPLPTLYVRRWRSLHQRASEARPGVIIAPEPKPAERLLVPQDEAPQARPAPRSRPREEPADQRVNRPPVLGCVALAERPPVVAVRANRARAPVDHARGRQAQWSQARPPLPANTSGGGAAGHPPSPPTGMAPDPASEDSALPADAAPFQLTPPSGVHWAVAGGACLVITAIASQLGHVSTGLVLVPLAGVLLAIATARLIARVRPDEGWVGRWLVLGVVAKLMASYFRYHTLVDTYGGVGDATGYDTYGRQFAAAWLGDGTAPELPDLRRTNFLRWITGVVYYVFGADMIVGFFVFGLLALVGSYLWYRATVDAVPSVNKRLYLGLVLFVPSIAFWPSSIGKEALMQLGIGAAALGTSYLLRQRLLVGLAVGAAGGWLLWVVRPHLLALVTVAAGCAVLVGRVRAGEQQAYGGLRRPIGIIAMALLVVFTVGQGAEFLGIEDLSISSIEAELDEQTERSAQGGSEFDNGGNSLNPLNLPRGAVTVLLRPFPWETDSSLQLISALESMLLAVLIVARLSSLKAALLGARAMPFLLYCWVLTVLYAATFSSFANFGLLVRQRSLVLPALFVLLAVEPVQRRRVRVESPSPRAHAERHALS